MNAVLQAATDLHESTLIVLNAVQMGDFELAIEALEDVQYQLPIVRALLKEKP